MTVWRPPVSLTAMRLIVRGVVLLSVGGALLAVMHVLLPPELGIDWRLTYRPAAMALVSGRNPYETWVAPEAPFFAAPWGLLPLLPLLWLPVRTGALLVMLLGFLAFTFSAYKLGARPFALGIFLASPPVMHCILNANIEWLVLLGFALPPQLGLLLVTIKPQTGFAVALFWIVEAWRKGGWRGVFSTAWPLIAVTGVSGLAFGCWPLRLAQAVGAGAAYNSSLWPWSIPIGFVLLAIAFRTRRAPFAMAASPMLSPYVLFHSWSSAIIAMVRAPWLLLATVLVLWAVILRALVA